MEKPLLTVINWVEWSLRYGTSLPAPLLYSGKAQKRDNNLCLPWCQTLQPLPVCQWYPSSFQPSAGARGNESEQVSPCVGSLRGTAWVSRSFFHWLNPHWILHPEVVGTYLPGTAALGWGSGVRLELLTPEISLLNIHHTWVWDQPILHLHSSYQSGLMWFL